MKSDWASIRRHAPALLASLVLMALAALCAWGGWAAAQPQLVSFLLPGARDIHQEPIGPGMQAIMFTHDGPVVAQTIRLYAAVDRRGWQVGQPVTTEDCEGPCMLGAATLIFTRQSLAGLVQEAVTIDQRGAGPYHVRVVLRRCVRLPLVRCWPPG